MKISTHLIKILSIIALISVFGFTVQKEKSNFNTRKVAFNTGWNFHLNDSVKDKDTIKTRIQ